MSVQPSQNDWQHKGAHNEDQLEKSFRDWMIVPGDRPPSHKHYENEEENNDKLRRGFHALTLSRDNSSAIVRFPDLRLDRTQNITGAAVR